MGKEPRAPVVPLGCSGPQARREGGHLLGGSPLRALKVAPVAFVSGTRTEPAHARSLRDPAAEHPSRAAQRCPDRYLVVDLGLPTQPPPLPHGEPAASDKGLRPPTPHPHGTRHSGAQEASRFGLCLTCPSQFPKARPPSRPLCQPLPPSPPSPRTLLLPPHPHDRGSPGVQCPGRALSTRSSPSSSFLFHSLHLDPCLPAGLLPGSPLTFSQERPAGPRCCPHLSPPEGRHAWSGPLNPSTPSLAEPQLLVKGGGRAG